jgi:hypothetical protein
MEHHDQIHEFRAAANQPGGDGKRYGVLPESSVPGAGEHAI